MNRQPVFRNLMKSRICFRWWSVQSVLLIALGTYGTAAGQLPDQPNVIVILADDMGIDSVAAFNEQLGLETPALDRLAQEGMSFMDAHSTSGVCSPTRYSVLTGRYNWRSRLKRGIVGKWERPLIAADRLTLPELFQQRGYRTAMIGKWHLGWNWPTADGRTTEKLSEIDFGKPITGGPNSHGFDYYFGDDVPNWPPYAWRENERLIGEITTSMKRGAMVGVNAGPAVADWDFRSVLLEYGRRCADYVRKQQDQEQPFFLYVPLPSPHTPIAPGGRFRGISGISEYVDFLIETDWAVGEILKALDETNQADQTLIFFTCDNGTSPKANFQQLESRGVQLRKHWRGHKADVFEGGHRVPFIVRWPGMIAPGTRSDQTIALTDIMATCADVLESRLPEDAAEDSISLLPVLQGKHPENPPLHEIVIHHSGSGCFAVRKQNWKLLLCRGSGGWSAPNESAALKQELPPLQLYDLQADPRESRNLAADYPDKVSELANALAVAIKNGRTTAGPQQKNEGWPNTIPGPILKKFPQLAQPQR